MLAAVARGEPGSQQRAFKVLAQGCVPGEQTVPRAELCAIIWATAWTCQSEGQVDVYADCQPAIDTWQQWYQEGFSAVRHKPSSDLFRDVAPLGPCRLHKVKAHQSAEEWQDRWLACGNDAADSAAKAAYQSLPEVLRDTADQVAAHCVAQQQLLRKFCRALLDIGIQDIKLRESARRALLTDTAETSDRLDTFMRRFGHWQLPSGICQLPELLEENWQGWSFGVPFGQRLLDWLKVVHWPVPPDQDAQISYFELLFHFTWLTKSAPPVTGNVGDETGYQLLNLALRNMLPCTVGSLVTIFRTALKQLGRRYDFVPIPGVELKNVAHLQWFGVAAPSPGVKLRPALPGNWLEDFRWLCEGDMVQRLGSFCEA